MSWSCYVVLFVWLVYVKVILFHPAIFLPVSPSPSPGYCFSLISLSSPSDGESVWSWCELQGVWRRPRLTSTVGSTDVRQLGCVVSAGQAVGELKEAVELPDAAPGVPPHLVHHAGVKMCHRLHSAGNWLEGNQRTIMNFSLHPSSDLDRCFLLLAMKVSSLSPFVLPFVARIIKSCRRHLFIGWLSARPQLRRSTSTSLILTSTLGGQAPTTRPICCLWSHQCPITKDDFFSCLRKVTPLVLGNDQKNHV